MKIVPTQNQAIYGDLINRFAGPLLLDRRSNGQKILEVCHVSKFLTHFERPNIERRFEAPDFLIVNDNEQIGLEHQVVIDSASIENEGFIKNVFSLAEQEFQEDSDVPNFLLNCYIKPFNHFKIRQKSMLLADLKNTIRQFLRTGELIENSLIRRIHRQRHSGKALVPNLGGWCQKIINRQLIDSAIKKKETKIERYIQNTGRQQWLLLVIGSVGESSYKMNTELNFAIETKFDKVFIMEDFDDVLYELK